MCEKKNKKIFFCNILEYEQKFSAGDFTFDAFLMDLNFHLYSTFLRVKCDNDAT